MRALLAVAAVALLWAPACKKANDKKAKKPDNTTTNAARAKVADAGTARYTCAQDSDCVVSCNKPKSCCPDPCACENVYHKDELAALDKANKAVCAIKDLECDEPKCEPPDFKTIARCTSGTCTAALRPYDTRMVNGFFTMSGAPDPVACRTADDCLGDTVSDASGCCNNPRSLRAYSKKYRKWLYGMRSRACKGVKCPPPPAPAKPADCNFKMKCVENQCANSCPKSTR